MMDKETFDSLAIHLKEMHSDLTAQDVLEIVAGVAASPIDEGTIGDQDGWISLIAEKPDISLTACLKQQLGSALDEPNGLKSSGYETLTVAERLATLRSELDDRNLAGFIVPLADQHQGEYIPKCAQRLAWLTGFTGSAGIAIILADKAAIFVDGRYTLQVANQADGALYDFEPLTDTVTGKWPPGRWIEKNLPKGGKLGFDPWLHTVEGASRLRAAAIKSCGQLTVASPNPIDQVWHDRPAAPISPVELQAAEFTGQSSGEKRASIAAKLKESGHDAVVLTAPDSIAWLANIRGGDVPFTPLVLCFAILHSDQRLEIYVDRRKVRPSIEAELDDDVKFLPSDEFRSGLISLGKAKATVRLDKASAAEAVSSQLIDAGAALSPAEDPCQLPKAIKNSIELNGIRNAHTRDGVALTRFLAWLDCHSTPEGLSETEVADKLDNLRRSADNFRGLSFPTISGAGPNGAIIHYRAQPGGDRKLLNGSLYLVDSGGQYFDGTTDVTRTVAIGRPDAEMRDRFTRVLKGHIALASVKFPAGTTGSQLDILARKSLWQVGLDYEHGTGHGVGNYLGVHEGPQRISKIPNRIALEPGMIISNEPGYYKTEAYGIRIENLVAVQKEKLPPGGTNAMLSFEVLTVAPIDRNLVEATLLTREETDWLNGYHQTVVGILTPLLDQETAAWLAMATQPI